MTFEQQQIKDYKKYEKQETMSVCDTELSLACDEFLEAHKNAKDAVDHLACCKERLADLMISAGLRDKQHIRHDGKLIVLKEGKVTPNTVAVKREKED